MATEPLMTLGEYVFGVSSAAYDEMRRAAEYRWAAQDRIGRPPARQWIGPGEETVDLSGTIYPVRRRAEEELDALRAEAAKGEPLRLMLGTGEILGLWVIERIRETGTVFLPDGVPRKVEFSVRLAYHGADGDDGRGGFLAGDTAAAAVSSVAAIPQALPTELALRLPSELADSLPAELPDELADSLPEDLPEGLATGRGGAFGAVLSSLADGSAPLPGAVRELRGQVRRLTGRLDLERQAQAYVEGLPGGLRSEDLARATSRVGALEAVIEPPKAVLRHVGGVL